jgi:hypothetical protein
MSSNIKNIIIFISIAIVLILVYVFFIKQSPEPANLVSVSDNPISVNATGSTLDKDFLPILLNIKNIKLDDSIFSDPAFIVLIDSNVVLVPEGNEGRPNPFASFGVENKVNNKTDTSESQSN